MKMLVVGECAPDQRYELVDPSATTEAEFENDVARALACYRVGYKCLPFRGTFTFEDHSSRPDLALFAPDWSHWYVVEVELVTHSLQRHVLPQVRTLRFGECERDCVGSLAAGLQIDRGQATTLLRYVPRSVVIVANRRLPEWEVQLQALDAQLVSVSIYRAPSGGRAYEIDGELSFARESVGFGTYRATDRSILMPAVTPLPEGEIQLAEKGGPGAIWRVVRSGASMWVTKVIGAPELEDDEFVQILRTYEGRLTIRRTRDLKVPWAE